MLIPTSNLLQDWVPTPLSFMGLQTLGKFFFDYENWKQRQHNMFSSQQNVFSRMQFQEEKSGVASPPHLVLLSLLQKAHWSSVQFANR